MLKVSLGKRQELKAGLLVCNQRVFFLASGQEHGLGTVKEHIQAFAFDHDASTVFYRFVFFVFSESNGFD